MTSFLQNLNWRFATKSFAPNKIVSAADLEKILTAIKMAPSSFGLQPYHVVVVTNPDIRKKLHEAAWNQPQVIEASHLLVFCSRNDTAAKRVDELLDLMSHGNAEARKSLAEYEGMMRGAFKDKSPEQQKIWADRQTYLALGFALAAAAELQIDACPMEGFAPEKFDEILELPAHFKSVVILPIGYRAAEAAYPKVRFPESDLFNSVA